MRFSALISVCLLLVFAPCVCCAQDAAPAVLSGYHAESYSYQYVTFGTYPYEADGTAAPVLWRVLGPGVPGGDDVICVEHADDFKIKKEKYANGDDFTDEMQDVFCLMTEDIIDALLYHDARDVIDGPALDYQDAILYDTMNSEVIGRLFTQAEQAALVDMPGRGLLSPPSRKGELFRRDYGFVNEDFTKNPRRRAVGTPYAFEQGLRHINGARSWYWTTDWRRYGQRWIVGDDGHISVSGVDRIGGIRPVCYVHTDMLCILGGDGTIENPYQLAVK